jgi:hypothetical protein
MDKKLEIIKTIANNFKEAWDNDFPAEFEVINEMQQTELSIQFPNLFNAIIGIMEFADDDGEGDV